MNPPPPSRRALAIGLGVQLATWGLYFAWLWPRMLFERDGALNSGWRTVWADWAHHFAYANVFASRPVAEWWSQHPLYHGKSLDYPFVADAVSGLLMRAGLDAVTAFVWPSVVTSLALVGALYAYYVVALGRVGPALLASALFFANGGLGFLRFLQDATSVGLGEALRFPPREYAFLESSGIEWSNVVSTLLLPQRGLLLGLLLALGVLVPLARRRASGLDGTSAIGLVVLGVLASTLLAVYAHTYLALVALCSVLLLFDLRSWRSWSIFAAAAALPSLLWLWLLYTDTGLDGYISWAPGWVWGARSSADLSLLEFLWLNWGVFLPLAGLGILRGQAWRDPLVVGGMGLFLACFLLRFMPLAWDNNKLLVWAHLLLCAPAAAYLAELWGRRGWVPRSLAACLLVVATATGGLELWRLTRTDRLELEMWSSEQVELAAAFGAISRPDDLVLCSDAPHHWVAPLAGRPVVLGYRGWLLAWGIPYGATERDVRAMLQGRAEAETLIEQYGVAFAVIGPDERRAYAADEAWWREHFELVLDRGDTRVFRVRGEGLARDSPVARAGGVAAGSDGSTSAPGRAEPPYASRAAAR